MRGLDTITPHISDWNTFIPDWVKPHLSDDSLYFFVPESITPHPYIPIRIIVDYKNWNEGDVVNPNEYRLALTGSSTFVVKDI